jgi:hypothetical protein
MMIPVWNNICNTIHQIARQFSKSAQVSETCCCLATLLAAGSLILVYLAGGERGKRLATGEGEGEGEGEAKGFKYE